MLYTVYILYSWSHKKIYIGYTSNLLERFKSHNQLGKKGFTLRFRPWVVIFCEHYTEKSMAIKRENELKAGQGRAWIHRKIENELSVRGFISA